jgi:hypothetical protein
MAFVDNTGNDDLPSIYNVSFAVGADEVRGAPQNVITTDDDGNYISVTYQDTVAAPNHRDDVMLVQFLLKKCWEEHGNDVNPPLPPPPEPGTIKVDGYFGPITGRWITQMQILQNQRGHPATVDGRVDRAHGITGSISHNVYLIVRLNATLRDVDPAAFGSPSVDTGWPSELIAAIMANTPGADS